MGLKEKCKVVLLPTKNDSNIRKNHLSNPSCLHYSKEKFGYDVYGNNQHLYILSDDEIINLDSLHNTTHTKGWYYVTDKDGNPNKLYSEKGDGLLNYFGGGYYSNGNAIFRKVIATTDPDLIKEGVASIGDEFIKEYVSNPIEEVLVSIDRIHYNSQEYKDYYSTINGCIIIKPIEETWDDILFKVSLMDLRNWLKENYEVPKKK